jgi:hypothetical protein
MEGRGEEGQVIRNDRPSPPPENPRSATDVVGSDRHRPDEEKLSSVADLLRPVTKREVRRTFGFFSYFRAYIPNAADLTHVLSDLVAKDKPNRVLWSDKEEIAFQKLKQALYDSTRRNLFTLQFGVHITVFSDSNPLTYITSAATKSAKLTRWALALQEFDLTFKYRRGSQNVVPDFLSRPCGEAD